MTLKILENIVVFHLDIRLWSGRKKLRPEDLAVGGIDPKQLPPGTLASLGSKRIIASESLAPFAALKREAEKTCLAKGVRFLGGYAVAADAAQGIHEHLTALRCAFDTAKQDLLQNYEEEIQAWLADNPPEWAPVIRAAVEPVSHVDKALAFGYTPVSIAAPQEIADPQGLDEQALGLFGQLCHEVRQQAKNALDTSYVGRSRISRKALRPLHALRDKLMALCFLDPQIPAMIAKMDDTLGRLPRKGPIEGADLNLLAGLLSRELACFGQPLIDDLEETDGKEPEGEGSFEEVTPHPAGVGLYPFGRSFTPTAPLAWDF